MKKNLINIVNKRKASQRSCIHDGLWKADINSTKKPGMKPMKTALNRIITQNVLSKRPLLSRRPAYTHKQRPDKREDTKKQKFTLIVQLCNGS